MTTLLDVIKNPRLVVPILGHRGFFHSMDDEKYLKFCYKAYIGRDLDLENPTGFNEKLQWLKLHDHNPLYTTLVDKAEVKPWVAERIGWDHVVPTLGVWDSFDEIDFDALPERFVLKCTHDSGGLAICRDKLSFDIPSARRKIERSLAKNYYWSWREWPYKDVKPRILAEDYLDPSSPNGDLYDYKLFRFTDGRLVALAMTDRFTGGLLSETFFDDEWHVLPVTEGGHPTRTGLVKPESFEKMKEMAGKIADGLPFCRVDFYESARGLYFGEITLYPNAGLEAFDPADWNETFGSWIDLSNVAGGGYLVVNDASVLWVHDEAPAKTYPSELIDYKFYCFDGVPKMMFTATGRSTGDTRFDFFDMDFNHLDIKQDHAENADYPIAKPVNFDLMAESAKKLSAGIPHVRVDFYEIGGQMFFGELTFYDASGFGPFEPEEWDERLGGMINLSGVGH